MFLYCIFSLWRTGSGDCTVRLWSTSTGALLQVMKGHSDWVHSVMYSPDGRYIASGSDDRTVRIWDAISGLQVGIYTGHSDQVMCIAFSADGLQIASGDRGGNIHVWSAGATDRSVKKLGTSGWVLSLAFTCPNRLVVGSWAGSIRVFDLGSASCIEQHDNFGQLVAISMAPDKKLAASLSMKGDLTVWDMQTWTKQRTISSKYGQLLSFSP